MAQGRDHETSIRVPTPDEFRFAACLTFLARSANECMHVVRDGTLLKALQAEGEPVLFQIGCTEREDLLIDILTPSPSPAVRSAVVAYVREWFDLDTDLRPFYQLAEQDRLLGSLVHDHYGLRLLGFPDLFEAVTWAIVGQQVNLAFAYTLKRRLVETFGEPLVHAGETYWLYPTPEALASRTVEELTALQITRRRAEYLLGFARLMADGSISKAGLQQLGDHAAMRAALLAVRGIGPWTAEYVLMKCLHQPQAFPIQDVGLHNAIKHGLQLADKPTLAEIRELAGAWTNWEAYSTFYLWSSLYGG